MLFLIVGYSLLWQNYHCWFWKICESDALATVRCRNYERACSTNCLGKTRNWDSFCLAGKPSVYTLCFHVLRERFPWVLDPNQQVNFILSNCGKPLVCATQWKIGTGTGCEFSSLGVISWGMMNVWKSSGKIPGWAGKGAAAGKIAFIRYGHGRCLL